MKVTRQLGSGLQFEAESDTQKGLFEALANIDKNFNEVFGETNCGQCKSDNIYFKIRDVEAEEKGEDGKVKLDPKTKKPKMKKYRYYEVACRDCWAALSFGQHQEGETLFPRRKLSDGTWDNTHRGWKAYVKKGQNTGQTPKQQSEDTKGGEATEGTPF